MTLTFVFLLTPAEMAAFLGLVAVWLVVAIYKYVASLLVGG